MNWETAHKLHVDAAADFADAAARVPADAWLKPREEGKWSPAEIVEHISLAYEVLLREIAGGPGMAIRTKAWQRVLLKLTMVPGLLRGKPFPKGARAPRETRPTLTTTDQTAAIASFRDRARRFDAAAVEAQKSGRRVRLTHAYFGVASLRNAMILCARHIQHHRKQL
jgi:uncharacterized damage-inducible protein DinB